MTQNQPDWGTLVAVYAAVVATCALIWNIVAWRKDAPNIQVRITEGLFTQGPLITNKQVFIKIINKGKRPLTIESAGFRGQGNNYIHLLEAQGLPKRLNEGEGHDVWISKEELLSANPPYPWKAWVRDGTGMIHFSKGYKADLGKTKRSSSE